jgi:uncharacterized membrane protein
MVVSTGRNQREGFSHLSMQNLGETSMFSLPKNGESPISSSIKTALAVSVVASCVIALVNEMGWIFASNDRPDSSSGNFFGNASVIAYNRNANTISSPFQSSSSCVQNVALGSLGMLLTQNILPLVSTLFSCIPQANAQTTSVTYPPLLNCPSDSTFYYTPGQAPLFFSQTTGTDTILGLPGGGTMSILASVDNIYPGEYINIAPGNCNFYLSGNTLEFKSCANSDIANALKNFSYTNSWTVVPAGASLTRYLTLSVSSSIAGTSYSQCQYEVLSNIQLLTQSPPTTFTATTTPNTTTETTTTETTTTETTTTETTTTETTATETTATDHSTIVNTTTDSPSKESSTKYMIIGGAAAGGVALLGGTALGVYCLKKKKKQRESLGKELRLMHEFRSGDSTLDPKSSYSLHEIQSSASLHSETRNSRSFSHRNDSTPSSENQFAKKEMVGALSSAVATEASADPQDVQIVVDSVKGALSEGLNEIVKKFREET